MSSNGQQNLGDLSMLELFRMEVENQSAILNQGLLALEKDPSAMQNLESLMRAAHSIKGAARIVHLDTAVDLAHAMEDCFVAAQKSQIALGAAAIDVLLHGVDALTSLSKAADAGEWQGEHAAEMDKLVRSLSSIQRGESPVDDEAQAATHAKEPKPRPTSKAATSPAADLGDLSMLELFRMEVENQSAVLNQGLLALEKDPSAMQNLESLMRAAHSIKGAARIVQLDVAVTLAHAMEDCFVAAQEKRIVLGAEDTDVLLQGVDMLGYISQTPEAEAWLGGHAAEIGEIVKAIAAIQSPDSTPQAKAQTAPAAPPAKPEPLAQAPEPPKASGPRAAKKPDSEAAPPPSHSSRDRVVRVTAANLDRLMGLTGECLVEAGWLSPFAGSLLRLKGAQAKVARQLERLQESFDTHGRDEQMAVGDARKKVGECRDLLLGCLSDFEMFSRRLQNLTERLYREVISSRMRPFADGAQGFPRLVRDLSRKLGKKVQFEIVGESTEVDRDILEKLEAPLNHLLRNCVDHGIEGPEERIAAGKPAEGIVRLEAMHRAGTLSVSVSDDGRGIDLDNLRETIVTKKLASAEMVASLTENELMEFLFLPGFSTAGQVTETSGRGVGLDVVQSMVQEVGGVVRIVARPGKGATVNLQLPITLSVLRTLLVEIAGEPYAFPLVRIDRMVMLPAEDVELLEDRQYFQMDSRNIGLISARQLLSADTSNGYAGDLPVIVISDRLNQYGLVVDRFLGERDLVVRALDPRLGKVKDISASALMEDGSPLLIVDVDDMVRSIDNLLSGGRLRKLGRSTEEVARRGKKRILIVDDSITVREVQRRLLENRGYQAEVAVDGMDGWNAVRTGDYDLIISDVDMPRMNGIDLVTRIKQDPKLKSLPVMIVSYKDREEDRLQGLDAGANYYLTKTSFHDESLLEAVVDLIGEASS